MSLTISDNQLQQFNECGFVVLPEVFKIDAMEEIAARIEALEQRHTEELAATGGEAGISRAAEITFTSHLAEHDTVIETFVKRPEFVTIATKLLGPDIDLYWNQSVFKKPEGKKEFPWHQDDGYAAVDPSPYLTLWLALNDATHENGCISVVPGSHKRGLIPHWQSPIGLVCHDPADPDQGIEVPITAGSAIAFSSLTFHKSGVNVSDGIRKAYVIQYAKAGLRYAGGALIENLLPVARDGAAVG